ncbi:MAG: RNA pseudouridine synthase [Bacteroides sp.]|nr:RNA pseudouridine synthase [Bacteroides sp.]
MNASPATTLHLFPQGATACLPARFTYPFCYTPHPLCVRAAHEVMDYLSTREEWQEELAQGKMFGVLVVETPRGETGYVAAFSGILAGSNHHDFFVPPVYDLLQPDGFFKQEEEQISAINRRISDMQQSDSFKSAETGLERLQLCREQELQQARQAMKAAKARRDARRQEGNLSPDEAAALIRESQFQKAEYKRMEQAWRERIEQAKAACIEDREAISRLKEERKRRSAALQQRLFARFELLNARGERKNLCDIFADTVHKTPPAGAGECAAPKLLQYAYLQGWQPKAMAEFWWGNPPRSEVRRHGHYYPACKGKCGPILAHMLQGLQVEGNPLVEEARHSEETLEIIYEDEWMAVVNKPPGLLSVPGKEEVASVASLMARRYPEATGPLIVHRLDMGTSGLLVIAKDKETHQRLQALFEKRKVQKRYIAVLEGCIDTTEGEVSLPLRPDHLDRPRQVVDTVHGKPALTRYRVLKQENGCTRIAFYPLTGRTHQLRLHAAHPDGLNCPIKGDELYGTKAARLYLHADRLVLPHPITGAWLTLSCPPTF